MFDNNYKEKIINISNYVKNSDLMLEDQHVKDIIDLLSLDNPDPRDILIGLALTNPGKFSVLVNKIPSNNRSDLNVLNIKIILSLYQDRKYEHLMREAETLLDKGIPGTTLFGLLKTEITQDDIYNNSENTMIYGFILNAEELCRENNVPIL